MNMATYSTSKTNTNRISGDISRLNFKHTGYSQNKNKGDFEYDHEIDGESENDGEMISITMPVDNIDRLERESDINQVSLNTRINQIINDHLDWHSKAPQSMISCVPASLVARAVNQLTEQELFDFVQSIVNDLCNLSLLLRGEFSLSSFLYTFNIWLKNTRTPSRFEKDGQNYKIVIRHDMGYKYSYLIKEIFRRILEEKFHKSFQCTMTETTVLIRNKSFIEIVHERPSLRLLADTM